MMRTSFAAIFSSQFFHQKNSTNVNRKMYSGWQRWKNSSDVGCPWSTVMTHHQVDHLAHLLSYNMIKSNQRLDLRPKILTSIIQILMQKHIYMKSVPGWLENTIEIARWHRDRVFIKKLQNKSGRGRLLNCYISINS